MIFNAPTGQQIAHVDKIDAHFDKDMGMQIVNEDEVNSSPQHSSSDIDNIFHFICPWLPDDEKIKIHKEMVNYARYYKISDICLFMKSMANENKILLPSDPKTAFEELHRIGMPGEDVEGFSSKNFNSYYVK